MRRIAPAPPGIDWACVSPKGRAPLKLVSGNELKLVYPQQDAPPELFTARDFRHCSPQPMDGPRQREAMREAAAYCMAHPQ